MHTRHSPVSLRRGRAVALSLLVAAGCVNYLDRSALSIANSAIRDEFGLSLAQMGLLLSVFAIAYGLAQIPVGLLIDRFGPRRALGAGMALWSAAQCAAAGVGGFVSFAVARAALGVGEAPMYLAGTKVCTEWYPPRERAWPIGLFNASSALGPAVAPPLLTALLIGAGWRWMFACLGLAGFALLVAWLAFYRDPPLPEAARPVVHASGKRLRGLLRDPVSWCMGLGFLGIVYLTWLYATWLPDYLGRVRHLSISQVGIWAGVPQGCGFLGALAGGAVSQALARRGLAPVRACALPVAVAMALTAACTLGAALVGGTASAIALICVALFGANLASSSGWALASVATDDDSVATLEAIQNLGGSAGGALAPALTGWLAQASGSFTPPLALASAVALASAALYGFGIRRAIEVPGLSMSPASGHIPPAQ
jgi:MFS family permease